MGRAVRGGGARQRAVSPGGPLKPSASLFDLGLDSMGTVQLLLELEETFGVTFPDEALTPEVFATPGSPWEVVRELDPGLAAG